MFETALTGNDLLFLGRGALVTLAVTAVAVAGGTALGLLFGVLRAHGGKIDEQNRCRSPVSGSTRLSLTRGAVTSTAPALVVTLRDSWQPLRTTSR